jgi:Domain of Unknown Function (DUF1080)
MKLIPNTMQNYSKLLALFSTLAVVSSTAIADEYLTGIKWETPEVVKPGAKPGEPPSDAVVLFDGKDLSKWKNSDKWKVEDGIMIAGKGEVASVEEFGDCQLHIEWSAPTPPKGSGQGRGNSGVFFMNAYELQVLDSFDNPTYADGQAAAIYKQTPPMVNAMKPPGDWNVYDAVFVAPRFAEDGSLKSPASITAFHNGIVVLNHFELLGDTPFDRAPKYKKHGEKGPIRLQDHGNPVRFRNIWVRNIKPIKGEKVREPYLKNGDKETPVPK